MKPSDKIFIIIRKVKEHIQLERLIYFYLIISLVLPNIMLAFTEDLTLIERFAYILLPLGVYMLVASLSRKLGRTIWLLFPIMLMNAMQIVLLELYGRSVIAVDMLLNLTSTNASEAGELLGNLLSSVIFVCVLYLPSLFLGIWMMVHKVYLPSNLRLKGLRASYWTMGVGVACIIVCYISDHSYSIKKDLYPVNVAYNLSLAVKHTIKLEKHDDLSKSFKFNGVSLHPDSLKELYVLVVGETSRGDHWQLNGYNRKTNPKLSCKKGLFSFSRAMSESNTTHKSVPLLLSHLDSSSYSDSIYVVKSIISLFREAGFHTAFISNQQRNGSFIDFFGEEADTTIFLKDHPAKNATGCDIDLLAEFDRILSPTAKKQLIVLHSYGSHFSYKDRYTNDYRKFVPDDYIDVRVAEKENLRNAYDNTILETDNVLSELIEKIEKQNPDLAALVYTSDHGEDLFDDDRNLFLHASPCPTFYQLRVPFMVWLSQGYISTYPKAALALNRNIDRKISSSRSFFDTATRLAGIRTSRSSCPNNVASFRYREPGRYYLDDHNKSVEMTESGFQTEDLLQLIRLDGHDCLNLTSRYASSSVHPAM